MDPGESDVCTYCNRSIAEGVVECPYCHNYTDGKGPFGLAKERKLPKIFVVVGWLVVLCFVIPLIWALAQWLISR